MNYGIFEERMQQIKSDYNRWLTVKESLEINIKYQKQAQVKYATRAEIEQVTNLLVDLDTERQWIFERIKHINSEFGRIAV